AVGVGGHRGVTVDHRRLRRERARGAPNADHRCHREKKCGAEAATMLEHGYLPCAPARLLQRAGMLPLSTPPAWVLRGAASIAGSGPAPGSWLTGRAAGPAAAGALREGCAGGLRSRRRRQSRPTDGPQLIAPGRQPTRPRTVAALRHRPIYAAITCWGLGL